MPGDHAGRPQRAPAAAGRRAHRQPPRPRSGALRPEPARPDTNLAPCPSPPPPRSSSRAWGGTTASGRRCATSRSSSHTGATLAVLGSNGAGKTTLLRLLATLLRPHAGRARVLGRELPRDGWAVRGSIGFLGHEPLLYRDLTARENLDHHARLHRAPRERVHELLDSHGHGQPRLRADQNAVPRHGPARRHLPRRPAPTVAAAAGRAAGPPGPRRGGAGRSADRARQRRHAGGRQSRPGDARWSRPTWCWA